ncbi:expressed unknown protein [Seminavis robusta]|uniref:Uncharacterized protein n=1 Tax=Seminavis robusta TaxID=568900 RepID=A0A9N8ECE3_9STRA|nr:expressed unknown protein [Seminavis robusta]|eukprot:Sro942_g222731.1  (144) ;mRNA; f:38660-39091
MWRCDGNTRATTMKYLAGPVERNHHHDFPAGGTVGNRRHDLIIQEHEAHDTAAELEMFQALRPRLPLVRALGSMPSEKQPCWDSQGGGREAQKLWGRPPPINFHLRYMDSEFDSIERLALATCTFYKGSVVVSYQTTKTFCNH